MSGGVPEVSLGVSHGSQGSPLCPGDVPRGVPWEPHLPGVSRSRPTGAVSLQSVPFPPSRCAELLLAHGARVNLGTRERQVTALHVAARQGLVAHVELYLHHGADPSRRTHQGETPLNAAAAAAERPEDAERFLSVAERLLAAGADPGAAGRKGHTPLHNACANGHRALARLLLSHGADATVPNSAGDTPMDCALRAVGEYREQRPEETLALLLDHGALPAHPKVGDGGGGGGGVVAVAVAVTRLCWQMLRLCCQHPPALEVTLNAYDRVPPAEGWVEAVPPELWEVRGCPGVSWAVLGCPGLSPRPSPSSLTPVSPPCRSTRSSMPRPCAWRGGPGGCSTWRVWPSGVTWAPVVTPLSPGWHCHPPMRRYLQLPIEGLIS